MKDNKRAAKQPASSAGDSLPNRILGSLRDALNAASRDERSGEITMEEKTEAFDKTDKNEKSTRAPEKPEAQKVASRPPEPATAPALSATEAVREAKAAVRGHFEADEPTTKVVRPASSAAKEAVAPATMASAKTQAVRGKPKIARHNFHQDPVVGWLVVVGGPGLGAYRPIYEGNNAIGRGKGQRIPIDFGDDSISSEEQAYIRYDSSDRSFLFVPNLSKTNIVSVNDKRPTGAVKLEVMDVISLGRTQLAFVPFCGDEFDWSELADVKE